MTEIRDYVALELGQIERIPQEFTYHGGMQIIHHHLHARYDIAKFNEALNEVYDLIENKSNALGFGDDGDIFAPWS